MFIKTSHPLDFEFVTSDYLYFYALMAKTDRQSSARNFVAWAVNRHFRQFWWDFYQYYQQGLCQKFGLAISEENCDFALQYLEIMQQNKLDFTNSLRALVAHRCWRQTNDKLNLLHEFNLLNQLKVSI